MCKSQHPQLTLQALPVNLIQTRASRLRSQVRNPRHLVLPPRQPMSILLNLQSKPHQPRVRLWSQQFQCRTRNRHPACRASLLTTRDKQQLQLTSIQTTDSILTATIYRQYRLSTRLFKKLRLLSWDSLRMGLYQLPAAYSRLWKQR